MPASAWIAACALAVSPIPVTSGETGEDALTLYRSGAFTEAAAAATVEYVKPGIAVQQRVQHARMAQEALSRAYQPTPKSPAQPAYLCRALDVLEATWPLAVEEEDIKLHQELSARHRALLAARHPDFVCEVGTELRPVMGRARPAAILAAAPAGPSAPVIQAPEPRLVGGERHMRRSTALKTTGAVSLSLSLAALAVMVGSLVVRTRVVKAVRPLEAALMEHPEHRLTPDQGRQRDELFRAGYAAQQVAVASGVTGAVLLVVGSALISRGYVIGARARLSPMAGAGRAGLILEGRF